MWWFMKAWSWKHWNNIIQTKKVVKFEESECFPYLTKERKSHAQWNSPASKLTHIFILE